MLGRSAWQNTIYCKTTSDHADQHVSMRAMTSGFLGLGGTLADEVPDRPGHDLDHPQRPELRQEVFVDHVGVALPRAQLHDVAGQPCLGHVLPEPLPPAPQVGGAPLGYPGLGGLPRTVGVLLPPERPGRAFTAAQVPVVRRVPGPAVLAGPVP